MPSTDPAQLDLWISPFTPGFSCPHSAALLSADELARAHRFHFPHLRDFYLFCRSTLRRILSTYTHTPAGQIDFHYGPQGKPFLPAHPRLHFNASHSHQSHSALFLCAISRHSEIGVDVEPLRPLDDLHAIAHHFFSPAEQAHLAGIPPAAQNRAFLECWTRKEAVIKATGEGISRPLDSFDVAFGPHLEPQLLRLDDDRSPSWQIASLEPAPGYLAALASPLPWHHLEIKTLEIA